MKKWIALIGLVALIGLIAFMGVSGEEPLPPEARQLQIRPPMPSVFDMPSETYSSFDETKVEAMMKPRQVSILSVGDIMAHTIQLEAARTPDGYDFYPQFENIAPKVQSKDFAIGNLETVFAGEDRRYSGKNMIFNTPDNLGVSIKKAGFDILTTANNHSLDRGFYGIKRTRQVLDDIGLLHTGTYIDDNRDLLTFEKDGFSFVLLSYSFSTNGWPMPEENPLALNMMVEDLIVSDIKRAKDLKCDFIIVANHWGNEYHLDENHHQRRLADNLFYAGADIILGTHPHVLQPFVHKNMKDVSGRYKDKFIIYSQGNFLSGQRTYPRAIGMYINFEFERLGADKYVKEVSVMPTYVEEGYKAGKRFMRVLDMHQAIKGYEAGTLDISQATYQMLKHEEKVFIDHLFKKVDLKPELNVYDEYVIYKMN